MVIRALEVHYKWTTSMHIEVLFTHVNFLIYVRVVHL
jgi:hypothetical protein